MFNIFGKGKRSESKDFTEASDSLDAIIKEAQRQGWLEDRDLKFIPEILSIYDDASNYFTNLIYDANNEEPGTRETMVYLVSRYLFAKGVEGVILWGATSDGKISVYFHPKHLHGDIETEVPKHLNKVVMESVSVGESLFRVHQGWVIEQQKHSQAIDLNREIQEVVKWMPKMGIHYALYNQYQFLK